MKLQNKFQYIAKPAKVFMAALIILIAVSILQSICIEIEQTYARTKRSTEKPEAEYTEEEQRQDRIRRSAKEFLSDGTIHLIDRVEHISDQTYREQIYDINDNLLWEGQSDKRPYEYLFWANKLRGYHNVFSLQDMKRTQEITPGFSRYIEIPVGLDGKIEQIWRYYPGAKYFTGYNASGRQIGYAGSTGFSESKSKVKPFGEFGLFTAWCPLDASSPTLLWQTQRRIYQINFEKQEVEIIFESTESDIETERTSLHAWRDLKPGEKEYIDHNKYQPLIHCQTGDDKLHLILREPKQQLSLSVPRASVTATKQDIYVSSVGSDSFPPKDIIKSPDLYNKWLEERRGKPRNFWAELYKVDNEGNLELVNRYDWIHPSQSYLVVTDKDPRPAVQRYVCQFSPLMYDLFIRYVAIRFWPRPYGYGSRNDSFYGLLLMMSDIRPYSGIINLILSVLMMVFVFLHGWPRRTSWAKFIFWLVFTGLFNIAGLLTYLALNHTAVVRCPVCSKRRGLAQVDCVRCKAKLPAPEHGKLDLIFSN